VFVSELRFSKFLFMTATSRWLFQKGLFWFQHSQLLTLSITTYVSTHHTQGAMARACVHAAGNMVVAHSRAALSAGQEGVGWGLVGVGGGGRTTKASCFRLEDLVLQSAQKGKSGHKTPFCKDVLVGRLTPPMIPFFPWCRPLHSITDTTTNHKEDDQATSRTSVHLVKTQHHPPLRFSQQLFPDSKQSSNVAGNPFQRHCFRTQS
jgi:hypothetical protein